MAVRSLVAPLPATLLALALVVACGEAADSAPPSAPAPALATIPPRAPRALRARVLASHPHDATAYTQGLVWDRGRLYESAGLYGRSSLREVALASGAVARRVELPSDAFGEGLALVGDRLVQLTWREGIAFLYDRTTFAKTGEARYAGEGWGLCYDGRRLVQSDGTDLLTFRDPATLAETGRVPVRRAGQPVFALNELECVDGRVYANVYQTDEIVEIDPATGAVTAAIDAAGLLSAEERAQGAEVLNGIAWNPEKKVFYLTGKFWPKLFEVRFEP